MALKRELAAAVAIPIILGILFYLPPIAFNLLVAAIALAALWEFYRIAEKTGHRVSKTVGMGAGFVLLLGAALRYSGTFEIEVSPTSFVFAEFQTFPMSVPAFLIVVVFFSTLASLFALSPSEGLGGSASTVFGVISVALPAATMCYLRVVSPRAVLFLFLIVWGCDSFAYYTGKNFGRRKLAPQVSPNKTWEGTIGGLVGATLIGAVAGTWWLLPQWGPGRGALVGALASTAGQLGDLVESLWKRGAGVKDSGTFLPGHGGFYDRIDSLLFASPVVAAFLTTIA